MAFSQDFQILVTGSDDQRVRIFNAKTAQFICKLKGHEGMTGHRNEYVYVSVLCIVTGIIIAVHIFFKN